jgi:predicted transcriptional regulator
MTVRDVMRETPEAVSGNLTISTVVDHFAIGPRLRSLPVELDGRVVGVLGQDEIDALAPARWVSTRVRSVMHAIGPSDVVAIDTPLETLLLVPAGASGRVIVTDGGVAVGIIEGADLGRVLAP